MMYIDQTIKVWNHTEHPPNGIIRVTFKDITLSLSLVEASWGEACAESERANMTCECELRSRKWDGHGKCLACGGKYRASVASVEGGAKIFVGVVIDASELAEWTPERIELFFDGIAKAIEACEPKASVQG